MFLADLINNLVPKYYSQIDQLRAVTIISTSFAITAAMILLILYWVATKSFETKTTIFVALAVILLLAVCTRFVMQGWLAAGAWMLILLMVLINSSNMVLYGISSSSSAAYIIPILLTMFCVGRNAGFAVTALGCVLVFTIPILQVRGIIKSLVTYNISNLTFDAPVLTLIYLLVAIIVNSWAA